MHGVRNKMKIKKYHTVGIESPPLVKTFHPVVDDIVFNSDIQSLSYKFPIYMYHENVWIS
jgi:hypothetical protein